VCEVDLSDWFREWESRWHKPFVPVEAATQGIRPAVLELQHRLCACGAAATSGRGAIRFTLSAHPNRGTTEVRARDLAEEDPLAACVGSFVATYPAFDFRGDVFVCDESTPPRCENHPASFVMPLVFVLD
jgi:hypothetical protein